MNKRVVHSVFDQVAQENPDNIAVREIERQIDYKGLFALSNRIANTLLSRKVAGQDVIATYLESGIRYIGSILGINKAACIFMPLDVNYPYNRLLYIINEVRPVMFVTDETHKDGLMQLLADREILMTEATLLVLDDAGEPGSIVHIRAGGIETRQIPPQSAVPPAVPLEGEEGNYLLYTSGSTGRPKAIEGCHKGLGHFIHWEINEFALDSRVRTAQLAPLLFDVSLRDIFVPLLCGGTVCIPARSAKADPEQLLNWIAGAGVTLLHIVPSVFRLMVRTLEENPALLEKISALQYILLAGEPLYGRDVNKWKEVTGGMAELVNVYGPSETTLAKIFHRVNGAVLEPHAVIPLGRPLPNTAIIIIKDNRLCEVGEIGEIHIKTPFRSRGYYKNQELTQQCFIQNPLHNDFEDVVYRTGDLGKYLPDRTIAYIGRKDTQVKIRGNRVEIAEVEKAIMDALHGAEVLVISMMNNEGETVLACYYLEDDDPDIDALRSHLAGVLPDYMHPAFFVGIPSFPLGINGKVDKKALPKPEALLYSRLQYKAPATALEQKLVALWMNELGLDKVGVDNSFFDLGGHSLSATRIVSRIYRELGKEVSLREFFDHSTIARLALLIGSRETLHYQPVLPVSPREYYDVSHAQQRMWLLNQVEEERTAYNIPGAYVFNGKLDSGAFERAFRTLIARHESLRTVFHMVDGELKQQISDPAGCDPAFIYTDLREAPNREDAARQIATEEYYAPFDLEKGPLLRARLLHMSGEQFVFIFTVHHIVSDGWSRNVLISEVSRLYNAFCAGAADPLPPLKNQYKDYVAWQNSLLDDATGAARHREYWLSRFQGELPVLNLPADRNRPPVKTYKGSMFGFAIGRELSEALFKLGREQNASLFMILMASVKALLYRYTGQPDIITGTPVACRDHPDLEDQIGLYVNTLAIRTQMNEEAGYLELLALVKDTILDAFAHQVYPFDRLLDELGLARDMSRSPLFDVVVVLHNIVKGGTESLLEGVTIDRYQQEFNVSKFDLTFNFSHSDTEIFAGIEYNTDLFSRAFITRMSAHYLSLLAAICKMPDTPIRRLEYLSDAEQQLLTGGHRPVSHAPEGKTLVDLFMEQVERTPENPAVICEGITLSYRELNERANRIAHYLLAACSIRRNDRVGLLMDRSEWMVAGILGILKAGAAYVPVDPSYPADRIAFMLGDAGVCALLTDDPAATTDEALLPYHPIWIGPTEELNDHSASAPATRPQPEDLCYIIYTSGSTGMPKGVMVQHCNVTALLLSAGAVFEFGPNDIWTLFHSICFDFSVWELFGSLLNGGKLVVVSRSTSRNVEAFADLLETAGVTVLNQVPTMFGHVLQEVMERQPRKLQALRYVIFGGEALNPGMLKLWHERFPAVQLVNMYGITETTVHVTYRALNRDDILAGQYNIGVPLPHMSLYIMDRDHRLVPQGVMGEIVVGGYGVTKGYLNRPGLNNERFIADPYTPGGRLYCSGDMGVMLENGEVLYKGRNDSQVKIRGHRIEPGEISRRLLEHASVTEALVVSRADAGGDARLLAYYVSRDPLTVQQLRNYLGELLPGYMLPSHFIALERLPLTANGKVDHKALPEPHELENDIAYEAPSGEQEELLVKVWQEVLGRERIGATDNFFEVGGDSIKAIQIAARLYKQGCKVSVRDLFQHPVIRELAPFITKAVIAADQGMITGAFPLTPIQAHFFTVEQATPHHYNQAVMLYYGEGFDRDILLQTFQRIQEHHDIIRTTFRKDADGSVVQEAGGYEHPLVLEEFDLRGEEDGPLRLNEHANIIQAGINLEKGPLMKLALFHLKDGDRLLIVIHHLIIDGVSWRILFEDIEHLYRRLSAGEEAVLPLKTDAYKVWSEKLREYAQSAALLAEIPYWGALETEDIPLVKDLDLKENLLENARKVSFSLSEADTELLLTKVNVAYNTEINDILLVALGLSVRDVWEQQKVLIALEGHGREEIFKDIDVSRTIGWFTTIYPVLIDSAYEHDLALQIKEVKESIRRIPNKGIGYGILKHLTSPEHKQGLRFNAYPRISFNYLGQFDADVKHTFFQVTTEPKGSTRDIHGSREYDIELSGMISGGKLTMNVVYNNTHFTDATIRRFLDAYHDALLRVILHCCAITARELTPSDLGFKSLSIKDLDTFFD